MSRVERPVGESEGTETAPSPESILDLSTVTVIMPIGGLATRARSITNDLYPKHLVELTHDRTVLDHVCARLQQVGFRRFIFCLGHQKEQLAEHISLAKWVLDTDTTNFEFSIETKPLGPDGAIYNALKTRDLPNPVTVLPGDMFLPWDSFKQINQFHLQSDADITFGLTSVVTERTTDVGKILIDAKNNRLLKCYRREEPVLDVPSNAVQLTSAGMGVINPNRFKQLCASFLMENGLPEDSPISIRDNLLPWMENTDKYIVMGYDLQGEALDLGTPQNIAYGMANWTNY